MQSGSSAQRLIVARDSRRSWRWSDGATTAARWPRQQSSSERRSTKRLTSWCCSQPHGVTWAIEKRSSGTGRGYGRAKPRAARQGRAARLPKDGLGARLDRSDLRLAAGQLRRAAVAGDELLGVLARLRVVHLDRRRLHQVRRGLRERAAEAVVQRELAAAHGVGDDPRRVRRVPHLELQLDVQRHIAERLTLDT